jgi:regulator of nonsense transcripts 2
VLTTAIQLSNDPSLSSLPLLTTFLKGFSYPFLGLVPPSAATKQFSAPDGQASASLSDSNQNDFPALSSEEELVEKETRDKFRRMCEGYFESVSKKLVIEHNVTILKYSVANPHFSTASSRTRSKKPRSIHSFR